jgi:hypothetical protein
MFFVNIAFVIFTGIAGFPAWNILFQPFSFSNRVRKALVAVGGVFCMQGIRGYTTRLLLFQLH